MIQYLAYSIREIHIPVNVTITNRPTHIHVGLYTLMDIHFLIVSLHVRGGRAPSLTNDPHRNT